MARILFKNCRVWDGSGAPPYPADVLIEADRIRAVATQLGQLEAAGADIIDAAGTTLMPGLVEGHAHITFINAARPTDLGDTPPEEHTLIAARNARMLLDHGFTSAYSAASAKLRIDVVIRHGIQLGLEVAARAYPEMKKRGIRVVIGGDYCFARTPQGENARDIEHFVRHLGYTPTEALICATRYGAELMGLGHEAGQVREGFLADLLLVDGDPVADVTLLQHKHRLLAILKAGEPHKLDRVALARRDVRAAE